MAGWESPFLLHLTSVTFWRCCLQTLAHGHCCMILLNCSSHAELPIVRFVPASKRMSQRNVPMEFLSCLICHLLGDDRLHILFEIFRLLLINELMNLAYFWTCQSIAMRGLVNYTAASWVSSLSALLLLLPCKQVRKGCLQRMSAKDACKGWQRGFRSSTVLYHSFAIDRFVSSAVESVGFKAAECKMSC